MGTEQDWLNFLKLLDEKKPITQTVSTSITIKEKKLTDSPLIEIPLDKLFEFYGNLVLAGFSEDEALVITCSVVNGSRTV